jgi:hypothetical protein
VVCADFRFGTISIMSPGNHSRSACRTLEEVRAAADADSAADPPLTQDQADLVATILAPYRDGAL